MYVEGAVGDTQIPFSKKGFWWRKGHHPNDLSNYLQMFVNFQ